MQSNINRFNPATRIQRLVQEKKRMKRREIKEKENEQEAIDQEMDDTLSCASM